MFAALRAAWPYLAFYWQNRERINKLLAEAMQILRDFQKKYPTAPQPTVKDVTGAITDSVGGRTTFTPKKVRDWTPQEWKNYWDKASGTGQF